MEKSKHKADAKVGKIFLVFAGICIVALPLVVFSAFSSGPQEMETTVIEAQSMDFDHNGKATTAYPGTISKAHQPNEPSVNIMRADSIRDHRPKSRILWWHTELTLSVLPVMPTVAGQNH
jgi:hypothetical protein